MKITVADIMQKKPCLEYTEEIIKTLIGEGKTLLELASLDILVENRIWIITRFLDDKTNRRFAIWCARQCKTDCKEITYYLDVIERYYDGKATKKELNAASRLAVDSETYNIAYMAAAQSAAYKSAQSAAYKSAQSEAYKAYKACSAAYKTCSATYKACSAAYAACSATYAACSATYKTCSAAYKACSAAYAACSAAYKADRATCAADIAAYKALWQKTQDKQIEKLQELIGEKT